MTLETKLPWVNTNVNNSVIAKLRQKHYGDSMARVFGFQREFWRDWAQTGSVTASSPGLARAMVEPYWNGSREQDVLEIGSGTGIISERIFRSMQSRDQLTIVEINRNFLTITHNKMVRKFGDKVIDERVSFINGDFLQQRLPADKFSRICCSLPFNNFEPAVIQEIFQEMYRICQPGGMIVFYEYILLRRLRYWLSFGSSRNLKMIEGVLSDQIRRFGIEKIPRFSNFPPAMVYLLRKPKIAI